MSDHIQAYLSNALDQEACKATLMAALKSRVATLQQRGISEHQIIESLKRLCDDPEQLNDDVIYDVIELILVRAI